MKIDTDLLARARAAGAAAAPHCDRGETERRLPAEAVAALTDAGIFKLCVPSSLGGADVTPPTLLAILAELARTDGALGWCAMIGATSGLMSRFLPAAEARAVYTPPDVITCGVFAPLGRAERVEGGYRVTGRWPFASGCEHSHWRMGGAIIDNQPRSLLFPASDTTIDDTWFTVGLRGTGSHDLLVDNVFVPDARCFSLIHPDRSVFGILASGVAAVALGLARAAIDSLTELARAKTPLGAKRSIANRELIQLSVARAEAKHAAARAFLLDAAADTSSDLAARARLRLAACHAATESAAAVDLMYEAGGASSIYTSNRLQRCFRDVHVATQHIMVSPTAATQVGRVLLGLESDVSTL